MTKLRLILASTSPGRKNILSTLKIPFEIVDSHIDEDKIWGESDEETVVKRAETKGLGVQEILGKRIQILPGQKPSSLPQHHLIIAADSMVVFQRRLIGKIRNLQEQAAVLKLLSGKTHNFLTGVWIKNTANQKIWKQTQKTKVTIRKISDKEIRIYQKADDLSRYAGCYSLFNSPQNFITKIEGSITNVVGLPLEILLPILAQNKLW